MSLSLSLAWRGYVARQHLKQIRKEREEAAVCIQSGKEMFIFSSEVLNTLLLRPLEILMQSHVQGKFRPLFHIFSKGKGISA